MNTLVFWFQTLVLRRKLWMVIECDDDSEHLYPLRDLIRHEAADDCPCGPATELHQKDGCDLWLYRHHSLDGREALRRVK